MYIGEFFHWQILSWKAKFKDFSEFLFKILLTHWKSLVFIVGNETVGTNMDTHLLIVSAIQSRNQLDVFSVSETEL